MQVSLSLVTELVQFDSTSDSFISQNRLYIGSRSPKHFTYVSVHRNIGSSHSLPFPTHFHSQLMLHFQSDGFRGFVFIVAAVVDAIVVVVVAYLAFYA